MILAMARGAGEVAPLMLVGRGQARARAADRRASSRSCTSSAASCTSGFHIYDLGFQSQNSEAAKPMVYTTTLC